MRQLSLHRSWLSCFALIAAVFAPLSSAAPASFQATIFFSEVVVPTGSTAPCVLVGTISGTGVASKVGAVHLASTDCINPLPPTGTSFAFSSSQVVLTTSRGDQIWATYTGVLSAEGIITGAYVVYGGTGHFANATGLGSIQGSETIDFATGMGSGQIRLQGTLSQ